MLAARSDAAAAAKEAQIKEEQQQQLQQQQQQLQQQQQQVVQQQQQQVQEMASKPESLSGDETASETYEPIAEDFMFEDMVISPCYVVLPYVSEEEVEAASNSQLVSLLFNCLFYFYCKFIQNHTKIMLSLLSYSILPALTIVKS